MYSLRRAGHRHRVLSDPPGSTLSNNSRALIAREYAPSRYFSQYVTRWGVSSVNAAKLRSGCPTMCWATRALTDHGQSVRGKRLAGKACARTGDSEADQGVAARADHGCNDQQVAAAVDDGTGEVRKCAADFPYR